MNTRWSQDSQVAIQSHFEQILVSWKCVRVLLVWYESTGFMAFKFNDVVDEKFFTVANPPTLSWIGNSLVRSVLIAVLLHWWRQSRSFLGYLLAYCWTAAPFQNEIIVLLVFWSSTWPTRLSSYYCNWNFLRRHPPPHVSLQSSTWNLERYSRLYYSKIKWGENECETANYLLMYMKRDYPIILIVYNV